MLSTQSTQGPSNCIIPLFRDHPAQVILVALGIIVCLGATFLMLASYQILPHTINSISHLCVWGQVMGYGTLGFGLILIAAGSVCCLVIKRHTDSGDAPLSNVPSSIEKKHIATPKALLPEEPEPKLEKNKIKDEKKQQEEATTAIQKFCRGYLAKKHIQEIKTAVMCIQSFIRRDLVLKKMEQEKRHILDYALFEKAKKLTEDSSNLGFLQRAPQGENRNKILMPKELPIVIRVCENDEDWSRFSKMTVARTLCVEKNFQHLDVPKARLHGHFIIEERLPDVNASTIKGMEFYFKNLEDYTDAVIEFTSFLCFG